MTNSDKSADAMLTVMKSGRGSGDLEFLPEVSVIRWHTLKELEKKGKRASQVSLRFHSCNCLLTVCLNILSAPQKTSSHVPQGDGGYEDGDPTGAKPVIEPKPKAVQAVARESDIGDAYAIVVKNAKSQPEAGPSGDENPNEYATVDKSKRKTIAATPGPSEGNKPKPEVKSKSVKKSKPHKTEDNGQGKTKDKKCKRSFSS